MPTVELWTADLDLPVAEVRRLEHHLDADERARANRFRFARDRRRFVVRRGLLRERLGLTVNQAPARLVFSFGPWGKPALRDHRCHFSLSHSHEQMALALSDVEVGCDIERIDEDLDWAPVANELFDPSELEHLALLEPAAARTAFFRCWTGMEARVKAAGYGLAQSNDAMAAPMKQPAFIWEVSEADSPRGYALAVAVAGHAMPCRLTKRQWRRARTTSTSPAMTGSRAADASR